MSQIRPKIEDLSLFSLYYSGWYAANSVISRFGTYLGSSRLASVRREKPGGQVIEFGDVPFKKHGVHKAFWHNFDPAVEHLKVLLAPEETIGFEPVSGDVLWLINSRNEVNYSAMVAVDLSKAFEDLAKDRSGLPDTLPKGLATQFRICRSLLFGSARLMLDIGGESDAFAARASSINGVALAQLLPVPFSSSDVSRLSI